MKDKTMFELNDTYKDCPVRTAEYTIGGKKYAVKSHFIGDKVLDDVIVSYSFSESYGRNVKDSVNFRKNSKKVLPNSAKCATIILSNLAALI